MKTSIVILLATLATFVAVSCKTSSPTSPVVSTTGTPTAIGTPIGAPTFSTIGAAGGSLMSPDGRLELIIPAGALSLSTSISIQPVTNEAPLAAGVGFSLLPNGLKFSIPVTLRFHYDDADGSGSDINAMTVATQEDDRIWYAFNSVTRDALSKTVSISTTHFSAYSLMDFFRISPIESSIAINKTLSLEVVFVSKAKNDKDPNDNMTPLANYQVFTNGAQVSWSVNGTTGGNQNVGVVAPSSGSSTVTYTAPASIATMNANPAAVTATVDVPGEGKYSLISRIKVLDRPSVTGRISLTATISGSKVNAVGGGTETKTENGSCDLVYDLTGDLVDDGLGSRSVNWDNAAFGGNANWVSDDVSIYGYICDNNKNRMVTDTKKTIQNFSSTVSGLQKTGVGLSINANGTYTIAIGPSTSTSATNTSTTEHSGYCINPTPESNSFASPIPFVQYFIPYVGGSGDKTTGKIDPSQPNRINGSYHGSDPYTVFSHDTTVITLPLDYTITWDLTISQ
ncbi:MAG: hypothetical protein WCH46_07035 [bacterium]